MPPRRQLVGQPRGGLDRPPQRRLRIPPRLRIHQCFQRGHQPGVDVLHRGPTRADLPHPPTRLDPGLQLTRTPRHRVRARPHRRGDQLLPTPADRPRLRPQQQPPLLLVQMRPDLRQPARQPTLLHCADRHTTTLWDLSRQIVAYWCASAKADGCVKSSVPRMFRSVVSRLPRRSLAGGTACGRRLRAGGRHGAAHRTGPPLGRQGCCASLRDGLAAALDPGASAAPSGSVAGRRRACPGQRAAPPGRRGQLGCLTRGRRCGTVGVGKVASCPAAGRDFPPAEGC